MLHRWATGLILLFVVTSAQADQPLEAAYHSGDSSSSDAEKKEDSSHRPEKGNKWRVLGRSTKIFAPDEFRIQEPKQLTFHLKGVRMDAYSRGFAQGDAVYLEILRPPKVFGFYSYLYDKEGNQLPLTKTSWGYRILLPIGARDKREKIELTWKQSVSDRFGVARIEIPINEKSFPSTRWYNRVSGLPLGPAHAGGDEQEVEESETPRESTNGQQAEPDKGIASKNQDSESRERSVERSETISVEKSTERSETRSEEESDEGAEEKSKGTSEEGHPEEEGEDRLSQFMQKITMEKNLRSQVFERKGNDLITSRLAHPRDMHYVTSPCFTSRVKISYKYVNGEKVEVGRRVVMHNGVDLRGRPGTPIFAIADGQVVLARDMHFEGNFTVIDHGLGVFSGYMHQSNLRVRVGQYVRAGDRIGDVGNTGYSTGPHLHLALWIRGTPVDPMSLYSLPIRE